MSQIFLNAVRHLLDPVDKRRKRETFRVQYATQSGDIISGKVVCTSSNFQTDTFNFKFIDSGEIRSAHASLLLSINEKEIML